MEINCVGFFFNNFQHILITGYCSMVSVCYKNPEDVSVIMDEGSGCVKG